MAPVFAGLGAATSLIGVGLALKGVRDQKQLLQQESDIGRLNATLDEAARRRELAQSIAANRAMFANAGLDPTIGSPADIERSNINAVRLGRRVARATQSARSQRLRFERMAVATQGYARAVRTGAAGLPSFNSLASSFSRNDPKTT